MLFHGRKRFAHPGSEFASDLAESVEDIFSPGRLDLLLVEKVSGAAVLGAQAQHILASQSRDRAFQNRGTPGSFADLLSDFRSQPRIFRLTHQSQRLLDLLVPNQTEERRLLKLYRQSLAQRVVKYRIAGLVVEIREDNRILVG